MRKFDFLFFFIQIILFYLVKHLSLNYSSFKILTWYSGIQEGTTASCIWKALFQLLVQTVTSDPEARLTRVAKVEVVLVVLVWRVVPLLRICLVVVLHQRAKEDDEDDLQDETGDRQLQTHVGRGVRHVALLAVRWGAEVDLTFQQRSSVSPGVEGGRLQGERGWKVKFTERPTSRLSSVLLSHWVTPTGPVLMNNAASE